jgi:2-polyprenyl-3-methyl-5-hydroxy-6-metoxy-1,4-benzoquinol methylase
MGGKVLDVGCGSGRDSIWFQTHGYEIYAHDASIAMVEHCKNFLGDRVSLETFEAYQTYLRFDGIWACSSLLHVRKEELPDILAKYAGLLNPGGVFFMSFKHREVDHEKDGRHFTNMTEASLTSLIAKTARLRLEKILLTQDAREGREGEGWVSAIAKGVDVTVMD